VSALFFLELSMRRFTLSLSLCFLSTIVIADEALLDTKSLGKAAELRDSALQNNAATALLESLTTEVGPRMAGSANDAKAVTWAQEKFKILGFDKVTLQAVTFPKWQRDHESAEILSPYSQTLHITALGASVGTDGKPLDAEVVEFASLEALKIAPENSLTGKIAFINKAMERQKDGSGYGPVVAGRRDGAVEAAKKGAVALLIRSVGTDTNRLAHTGTMRYNDAVKKIPAAALSIPDADLLAHMLKRGKPVTLRLDLAVGFNGTYTSYNVIGDIRGREKPDEYVVIGGHLDSWDLGTGAVDDGAGVSITMAAGALIGKMKQAPRRSIRVIAFANEEQGLYGGKAYADAHKATVSKHQIGAESDFGAGHIYSFSSNVDDAGWKIMQQIGDVLAPLNIALEREKGSPGPDIGPSVANGMPWAELQQDGSDYFDLHHTANDTFDKVDSKALDQQVAAYAVFAYLAAEAKNNFMTAAKPEEKK
jgi:Zn-dependent M28 family amino/carboxypeptidase